MIYSDFKDKKLSMLGFGAMRLPLLEDGAIDEEQVAKMVDAAFAAGLNYIDTAYPYHAGESERVLGRVLASYSRDSYYIADKFPGHQIAETYDPAAVFEEQLKRLGTDYIDFYLLHNVYGNSMPVYLDPQWGILDYFVEQKKLGRIKHLGFSTHADPATLEKFLGIAGEHMEFCQIQLNYLDWTLQDAKAKCEILKKHNIPVWVMEPLRGGKLVNLSKEQSARLEALRPGIPAHEWAFNWLQGVDGVQMILSGMSSLSQMQDNLRIFENRRLLCSAEEQALLEIAEAMKNSVPCTACRYCVDGCPQGLEIPRLIQLYNDYQVARSFNVKMALECMDAGKQPENCIACGKCAQICPQGIDIPDVLAKFSQQLAEQPSWAQICAERAAAQKK